jgi:hypothetical protein
MACPFGSKGKQKHMQLKPDPATGGAFISGEDIDSLAAQKNKNKTIVFFWGPPVVYGLSIWE